MLINDVCRTTGLTKKAVEYYIAQGLIAPATLDNGYRDFSQTELETLRRISTLRRLGLSIADIRGVLADKSGDLLHRLAVERELHMKYDALRHDALERLARDGDFAAAAAQADAIAGNATITEKMLDAFPGYFGRFMCLHFARFLDEPVVTGEQRAAYAVIIDFLDSVELPEMPPELQALIDESTRHMNSESIHAIMLQQRKAIETPDKYIDDNSGMLEQYMQLLSSDEYRNSPVFRLNEILRSFFSSCGYNDVFIPAMKRLSPSYADYQARLACANEAFLHRFPQYARQSK